VDVYRAHKARQLLAAGITGLALANLVRGDLLAASRLFREALTIFRELDNERGTANAAANLAETEYAAGNVEVAILLCEEAVATSRRGREERIYLSNMAAYLVRSARYDEARERARESILCGGLARADVEIALALQHLAAVAVLRTSDRRPDNEDIVRATCLLGFVDFRLTTYEATRIATELHEYEVLVNALHAALGEERFTELRQRGQSWSEDDAVEAAMKI
jgi:tetratricopeptide (TPR) repeat protein